MKVTISVGGRFHAFQLAKYFQEMNILNELWTSYPSKIVQDYGIQKKFIRTFILKEIIDRTFNFIFKRYPSPIIVKDLYDKWVSMFINKQSDIYIIWSSYGKYTIDKIRKYNKDAIIIIERGSTHIQHQDKVLKKMGVTISSFVIMKEVMEYSMADYISVLSSHSKKTFMNYGVSESKIMVNPLGVNVNEFHFVPRDFQGKPFVVGYCGSMSKRKNIAGLISIIEKLNSQNYDIELLLVGNLDSENELNLDSYSFVKWNASVPERELIHWYEKMHLFILPSFEDGFGMVVPQAMSTGLPVVVSNEAGASELISHGKNGFIFDPLMMNDCLNYILMGYNDRQLLVNIGLQASQDIGAFTWQNYGKVYVENLERVINA